MELQIRILLLFLRCYASLEDEKMLVHSYTKPAIYYICPSDHRIDKFTSWPSDLFCYRCNKLIPKTECKRCRDYSNGTRVLREANQKPYRGQYNHAYYIKRKNGLCKKYLTPHKQNKHER